jgi:hypothetical protein
MSHATKTIKRTPRLSFISDTELIKTYDLDGTAQKVLRDLLRHGEYSDAERQQAIQVFGEGYGWGKAKAMRYR